jgi:hypothetical protein
MTGIQTFDHPAPTRSGAAGATDAAHAAVLKAADTARRHRPELFILAGTIAFVVIVALLAWTALTG